MFVSYSSVCLPLVWLITALCSDKAQSGGPYINNKNGAGEKVGPGCSFLTNSLSSSSSHSLPHSSLANHLLAVKLFHSLSLSLYQLDAPYPRTASPHNLLLAGVYPSKSTLLFTITLISFDFCPFILIRLPWLDSAGRGARSRFTEDFLIPSYRIFSQATWVKGLDTSTTATQTLGVCLTVEMKQHLR